MAKFCGKCGSRLDEATGLCPRCDAEQLRQLKEQKEQPRAEANQTHAAPHQPPDRKMAKKQKKAARKAKAQTEDKPYTRKCAVCGRTDTDYPGLEFRYCSKCAGYHCFCEDHINNHIHFTE